MIYLHYDSTFSDAGKTLLSDYNTEDKAIELVMGGDLVSLTAYWIENTDSPITFDTIEDYRDYIIKRIDIQYAYLWNKKWLALNQYVTPAVWVDLIEAVNGLEPSVP